MTVNQPINNRIEIVDALRGFSLAGIVLAHFVENYIGGPAPQSFIEGTHSTIFDSLVDGFLEIFIRGKFFALFSFLFGLSFFIQMDRAAEKGVNFRGRFFWRILLLLGIGYIHHLFYRGDILTIYAIMGMFLIPFYRVKTKWLLLLVTFIFLGGFRYLVFMINGTNPIFSEFELSPNSETAAAYYNILKEGSILDVFKSNATQGHLMKLDFQFGIFSRGYLTFGFFLLGLVIGKVRFFENLENFRKKIRKTLIWSIVGFLVSLLSTGAVFALSGAGQNVDFNSWIMMIGLTLYDISNISMTIILICVFIYFWRKIKGERFLMKFAPYGRMALTNYVLQSIIGTALLYGWGLGLLGEIPNIYTFIFSFIFIFLQMMMSKWWLSTFFYGPLEWIWRSLTYFKKYPIKRK